MPDITLLSLNVVLPAASGLATVILFIAARRCLPRSQARAALLFFAVNGITLTVCIASDFFGAAYISPTVLKASPLVFTFLYLIAGGVARNPTMWAAGLATPGLWFLCRKIDLLWLHISPFPATLPQDPGWFLLAGIALFVALFYARMQKFWDAMERPELTLSACYFMGGLWLLSLGTGSVLALFSFPVYAWALLLLLTAGVFLWIAKLLDDWLLGVCGILGVIGSLYAGGLYVFAPVAA